MRIAAVLTSFNRRCQTVTALTALQVAALRSGADIGIVLVDDASTDGTADAVRTAFPRATVVAGSGNLFWNRGMHTGMQHALQDNADFILWLNDDTVLYPDALQRLLRDADILASREGRPVLLVGTTSGPDGRVSYGGSVMKSRWRRFSYRRVWSETEPLRCNVMNGNCVLLPMPLARAVGNLDPAYEHAMGDTDYALRAAKAGYAVYVASGFVGECATNPVQGDFTDLSLPLRVRWQVAMSRKGLPWRSWLHFTNRHGGWLWPTYFAWPYCRIVLSWAFHRLGVWSRR